MNSVVRRIRPTALVWVSAVVALSGCSSSDDPNEEETSTGGTSSTGGDLGSSGGAPSSGGVGVTGGAQTSGGQASGGMSSGGSSGGSGGETGGSPGSGGEAGDCVPDPNCQPDPPATGDFYEDCVTRVNQYRACMCVGPVARYTEGEACADQQAQYDYENDSAHAGIRDEICSPVDLNNAAQNECPGYPSVASTIGLCHQQMFDEGYCDDFSACGHFINMTDEDAESVACGYYETPEGDVWMVENFYF